MSNHIVDKIPIRTNVKTNKNRPSPFDLFEPRTINYDKVHSLHRSGASYSKTDAYANSLYDEHSKTFKDKEHRKDGVKEYANTNLPAGFYQMYKDKEGNHSVVLTGPTKKVPDEIYGKTPERVLRYWRKFVKSFSTIGILLVGDSGAGKSMEAEVLCNVAIKKGELPVIQVTGFEVTEQTIQYLEQLDNVVFYFDEFTKHVKWDKQDLLLSLLTNKDKKFLAIMTENDIGTISKYLKSRPGRAWYRRIFDKLEPDVVLDFISRHPDVKPEFVTSLMAKYKTAMTFTFDHLQAIIEEHLDYPDESLDDMLEILNVDILSKPKKYFLTNLFKATEESKTKVANGQLEKIEYKEIPFINAELEVYAVEQDRYQVDVFAKLETKKDKESPEPQPQQGYNPFGNRGHGNQERGERIAFNLSNLTDKDGATLTFTKGDYKVELVKAEPGKIEEAKNLKS